MGAKYLSYVKSIATYAPTFFGLIMSVLASVNHFLEARAKIVKNFVGYGEYEKTFNAYL